MAVHAWAFGPILRDRSFDDALAGSGPACWYEIVQDCRADTTNEIDRGIADDIGSPDDLIACGVERDGEREPVRGEVGACQDRITHRQTQRLMRDQERPDFLLDTRRVA